MFSTRSYLQSGYHCHLTRSRPSPIISSIRRHHRSGSQNLRALASLWVTGCGTLCVSWRLGWAVLLYPVVPPRCIVKGRRQSYLARPNSFECLDSRLGRFFARPGAPDQRFCLVWAEISPRAIPGPKATLRIDGHTHHCELPFEKSLLVSYRSYARHMTGSKRLHHGRVPVPRFLVLTSRGLPARLDQVRRLWQELQRLKLIDPWTPSARCLTPKSLS